MVEGEFLESFVAGCPPSKLQRIVESLVSKAEAGSLEAARLLLRHALPSGSLRVQVVGPDGRAQFKRPDLRSRQL